MTSCAPIIGRLNAYTDGNIQACNDSVLYENWGCAVKQIGLCIDSTKYLLWFFDTNFILGLFSNGILSKKYLSAQFYGKTVD